MSTSPYSAPIGRDADAGYDARIGRLSELMLRRVEEILLVSSPYDAFILEEDGLLTDLILSEYVDLGLSRAPRVTRVSVGEEALAAIRQREFDLVITMLRLGDMDVFAFRRALREIRPDLPVVLLIASEGELERLGERRGEWGAHSVYVWDGDPRMFLAIIKVLEDRWNVDHDTEVGGVGVIILVEDSARYRSSLLPIMYTELVRQTRAVMADSLNRMQRLLRLRARPKIVVAETYEEGLDLYRRYRDYLFGVIADVRFSRGGRADPRAGIDFIAHIKSENPDVPALLQSSDPQNRALAAATRTSFLHKHSRTLLADLSQFMLDNFGFGDFVFRTPAGEEVGRAADLRSMARVLEEVPLESLEYHARRNHFSNWLRARTEFELARRLRPRRVSEFRDLDALRSYLVRAFSEAVSASRLGVVEEFSRERFDRATRFARLGGGSLGGKARGLAFVDALLARRPDDTQHGPVRIYVPRSVVIGTDAFDELLDREDLGMSTLCSADDAWIQQAFLRAELPQPVVEGLRTLIETSDMPLAVRSSSTLEDSLCYPFAGVYKTFMLPNNHPDPALRLARLCDAVRLVYASTFFRAARSYIETTPHRIEAQRMAVVVQQLVGVRHENDFYPDFAGVLRSFNFYPFGGARPEDGVAAVALGLGKQVVEGGAALRFCPAYPHALPELASPKAFLDQSQRTFYALDLSRPDVSPADGEDCAIVTRTLEDAERQGTLSAVGSTWCPQNQALYDGVFRPGVRVVTFAHLLKSDIFPLADILRRVDALGRVGMGGPVEIEFAGVVAPQPEFAIVQIRPYGPSTDFEPVDLDAHAPRAVLCRSDQALGNGVVAGLRDVVYVKPAEFDAARTPLIAREIGAFNEALRAAGRDYVLIGPGRWGTANPWLGIPVAWAQISAARVIIEAALDHFRVDPSQGSHFFHNITSLGKAYLTVHASGGEGGIDWDWLERQPAAGESTHVRHVRLREGLEVRIDGRNTRAVILKRSRRAE